VHAYVAFDPLRQALFRRGHGRFEPMALVRSAITEHGFKGIKLYPPMGFKPWRNASQSYPKQVSTFFGGGAKVGRALDAALSDLYDLAVELDAPIMAHGANSNAGGEQYGLRADPHYWIPVWENWPRLRVSLAHFGSFDTFSEGAPAGSRLPGASWEYTFGRYIRDRPTAPVYADLGFYSEVLNAEPAERARIAGTFRAFVDRYDRELRHVVFGSDWTMLANQRDSRFYTERLVDFLRKDCRLSEEQLDRVLVDNPRAFLGI
jgi:predicted TIM-barrel fold metal-dependent hydrolase